MARVTVKPGIIWASCELGHSRAFERYKAVECVLEVCSENSWLLRSTTVWSPIFFWIEPGAAAFAKRDNFVPDLCFKTILDSREDYDIAVDDGRRIQGFLRYTMVDFKIMVTPDGLIVSASIDDVDAGKQVFFHEIPAKKLFWTEHNVTLYELSVVREISRCEGECRPVSSVEVENLVIEGSEDATRSG